MQVVPSMQAVIERRLLINYRVDPSVITPMLPVPLRPHLVAGSAVAGICLIRLGSLRPRGVPTRMGMRTENAAHRVAVEWDTPTGPRTGVYIPRRHSDSTITTLAGGRLYPGVHSPAEFSVRETTDELAVGFTSRDGVTHASVAVAVVEDLRSSSLFADVRAASEFFAGGSCGYSPARSTAHLEGMELRTDAWSVQACELQGASSSLFDDRSRFPAGSIALDCAVLMRGVPVSWRALSPLTATASSQTLAA